jgi:hypothetical protein
MNVKKPGQAPSPDHLRILAIVKSAGPDGVSRATIEERTGIKKTTVQSHLKNAIAGKKIHPGFDQARGRFQLYLMHEHVAAFRAANGLAPLPGFAPVAPNLPAGKARPGSLIDARPRNRSVTPARLAVETVMQQAAGSDLTPDEIATRAKVDIVKTRQLLQAMKQDGKVIRTGEATKFCTWRASHSLLKMADAAAPLEPKTQNARTHCNSSQPKMKVAPERKGCALPGQQDYTVPRMSCARQDAADHLKISSLQGCKQVPYTAPVSISSSVQGGVS